MSDNLFPFEFVVVTDELPWMMQTEYDQLTSEQQLIAELKGVQTLQKPFLSELSKSTRVRPGDL
jgi:hypothetical protein